MKLRLTDFDSNTYMDTDGSCDLCLYTGMLDHPLYTFERLNRDLDWALKGENNVE